MQSKEREKLMEKRSSLRSWRERSGRMPRRGELIGAALLAIIFLAFMASSFRDGIQDNSTSSLEQQTPAIAREKTSSSGSVPAPGIILYSPENTTYDTSTPPLNFIVSGSNMSRVLLSVDGEPNISIPHDGTFAEIDFARLNPLLIEDFSGTKKEQWVEKGIWRTESGKYLTKDGTVSFGNPNWDDYIIETKTKVASGKNMSIDLRWDGKGNYYSVQTGSAYGNLQLSKVYTRGNTNLFSPKLPGIDPANWHTWKIVANGSKIQGYIDDVKYIEYMDSDKPYLKGNPRLRVQNATVEYDYVNVYKPLLAGPHKVTIFANNTAGNASSKVVYFTVSTAPANKDMVGKMGVPLVKNGFEITVKSATPQDFQTSVWILAKNTGDTEKPFKLNPSPVIIDSDGNQYEKIKVARSAEIAQTDLYPQAKREGAVFFEKFREGAKPKRLVLYVNEDRFEFMLDAAVLIKEDVYSSPNE